MSTQAKLAAFVRESNAIEGIHRDPTTDEMDAHVAFLARPTITVADLVGFVEVIAPGKPLRDRVGCDVRVGGHIPPPGGPGIRTELAILLDGIDSMTPYEAHVEYELLHPFMDGNGRSGRALWAWHMTEHGHHPFALSFLQRFYYQTLDAAR